VIDNTWQINAGVLYSLPSDRTPHISIALYCRGDIRGSEKNYLPNDDGDSQRQRVRLTSTY
jgi:hypothetical protein